MVEEDGEVVHVEEKSPRAVTPRWNLRRELVVTARLNADNVWVASLPPVLFTLTAALRFDLDAIDLAVAIVASVLWSMLFIYVFDTANQAGGSEEDHANKPYRPIPSGLVTPAGMWRRNYAGSAIFVGLSATLGLTTFVAAIVWIATVQITHRFLKPRFYILWKPVTTWVGVIAQLGGSWAIAHSLDATAWFWIVALATMFIIPLSIEDVRDMGGDRIIGRVTQPLLFGATAVRTWFVVMMVVWPAVGYLVLFRTSGGSDVAVAIASGLMALLCWPTAVLTAIRNTHSRNRLAYKLYSLVHVALTMCAVIVLA
jgi:4-hydroxybenzoate polyprenyltransferase